MDITSLTSSDLERIGNMLKEKEKLQAQLENINAALRSLGGGKPAAQPTEPVSVVRKPRQPRRRVARVAPRAASSKAASSSSPSSSGRGALLDRIVHELQGEAGRGVHIKDLSERLGVKVANLRVWFGTESCFTSTKQFRLRLELNMHFKPDDGLELASELRGSVHREGLLV